MSGALQFILRNGQVPGAGPLPSLVHLTLGTLAVSGIGIAIATVIALPLGVWLGHIHRGSFVAINIGNGWRALPSLAVLAIAVAFLGLGLANGPARPGRARGAADRHQRLRRGGQRRS